MSVLLDAVTGYLKQRNTNREQDAAVTAQQQQRSDRLAQLAAEQADRQQQRALEQRRYDDGITHQKAADARQSGLDQKANYDQGFDTLQSVQGAGAAQTVAASLTGAGGLDAMAQGTQKANMQPAFTLGGVDYAKGHLSVQEQKDEATRAQQSALEIAKARDALASRAADHTFTAAENAKNRAATIQAAGIKAHAAATPGVRATQPTADERKSAALYIAGKQGYETLEGLLAAGKSVPSFTQQQLGKIGMGAGNMLSGDQYRQMTQAANQMADSWLRYTSGAAVPETEVHRFAQSFIPLAGDDPATLKQKRDSRATIMKALEGAAGRALPGAEGAPDVGPDAPARPAASSKPLRPVPF